MKIPINTMLNVTVGKKKVYIDFPVDSLTTRKINMKLFKGYDRDGREVIGLVAYPYRDDIFYDLKFEGEIENA